MSLIADSLKKAQREREQDKERLAGNILRASIVPELSRVSRTMVYLLLLPVVVAGIWLALLPPVPETNFVAKAPAPTQKRPTPPPPQNETPAPENKGILSSLEENSSQVTPGNPVEKDMELKSGAGTTGIQDSGPMEMSASHAEPPGPVIQPGKGVPVSSKQKTQPPKAAKPSAKPVSPENKLAEDNVQPATNQVMAQTPPPQDQTPVEIPYKPFVKTPSPLEKVAALTRNLSASIQPEPQLEQKIQTGKGTAVQISQEVPVTSVEKTQPIQAEEPVHIVVEPEGMAPEGDSARMAEHSGKGPAGNEGITFVPNAEDTEGLADNTFPGTDRRVLDDKSRYFNIAAYYHSKKDYFEALRYYEKALRMDPHNARIHNNRALIYKEMGRGRDAINELLQAVRIDPTYVKAYNNLGLMYFLYGDTLGATRHFEKAVELDPRNTESLNNLAILYKQQNRYKQAEMLYRKVILLDPNRPESHYNLALLYEQMGRVSDAVHHYRRFVELAQSSRPALAMKVRGHIRQLEELPPS